MFVRALPDHRWLDRLIRGRVWIPLLGVMLAGIVAMQVEVLKLGASMGRSLQRTTMLQSRNEQLRQSVASLADDQRIERLAAGMGMVMPAPDAVAFLSAAAGSNVSQAISSIHAPSSQGFISLLSSNSTAPGRGTSSAAQAAGATVPQGTAGLSTAPNGSGATSGSSAGGSGGAIGTTGTSGPTGPASVAPALAGGGVSISSGR